MKISEISRMTGINTYTLRYYEKIGVLKNCEIKRDQNGYRNYDDKIIELLKLIKYAKRTGFRLREIEEIFKSDAIQNKKIITTLLKNKLSEINKKIDEIGEIKKIIQMKLQKYEDA